MRRSSQPRKYKHWVILSWVIAVIGVIVLLIVFQGNTTHRPPMQIEAPTGNINNVRPTLTPVPTSYYLPTITPNPLATEIEDFSTPNSVCLQHRVRPAHYRLFGSRPAD